MNAIPPIWSALSPEEHEVHYNPQRAFPRFNEYRLNREPANAAAVAQLTRHADIAYGEHPLRTLDIYPAGAHAPVHVFFHGGYWRAQDKANYAFVARTLVPKHVTTVIVNYELCPDSTLDGVVASALAAMGWIFCNIGSFGGDPDAISISGHSAGAHLCAEILAYDWSREGIAADRVKGATLISGIYDPAPARMTSVNDQLNLTEDLVERHNVESRAPFLACPVALMAGGREPWQWIDQTFRYSHNLRRYGLDPAVHVLPGRNHFDILDEYLAEESLTMRAIFDHIDACRAQAGAS